MAVCFPLVQVMRDHSREEENQNESHSLFNLIFDVTPRHFCHVHSLEVSHKVQPTLKWKGKKEGLLGFITGTVYHSLISCHQYGECDCSSNAIPGFLYHSSCLSYISFLKLNLFELSKKKTPSISWWALTDRPKYYVYTWGFHVGSGILLNIHT